MNKETRLNLIVGTVVIVFMLGVIVWIRYCFDTVNTQKKILKKIDKIESNINSYMEQKDSIKTIIIKTEKEIDKNNKDYEKIVNTIINSNDSVNYNWAKHYIEEYREHLK